MKELRGSATAAVTASPDECVAFFLAVDRYPGWHPDVVRKVEVLERDADGTPTRAHGMLHVAVGPLVKDFDLILAVTREGLQSVKLARIPHGPGDHERFEVTWHVGTQIRLELFADLSVPRFVPLGGVGDSMAQGFVSSAARALRS